VSLIFSGCSVNTSTCFDQYGTTSKQELIYKLSLEGVMNDIAYELCNYNGCNCASGMSKGCPTTIITTDFVDVRSLRSNKAGMFLNELLRSSMSQFCCSKIVQAEVGKYFRLNDKEGFVSLTRDVEKIKSQEYRNSKAIVSTYSISDSNLYLFVRVVDVNSGKITKMIKKKVSFVCIGDTVVSI
jgi:hypothetical protein